MGKPNTNNKSLNEAQVDETSSKAVIQENYRKKTSRLAIASLIFGILTIPLAFYTGELFGIGPLVNALYVILVPLSIILGIAALIRRTLSRTKEGGVIIAILGIVAALFSIFCAFIHFINSFNY